MGEIPIREGKIGKGMKRKILFMIIFMQCIIFKGMYVKKPSISRIKETKQY